MPTTTEGISSSVNDARRHAGREGGFGPMFNQILASATGGCMVAVALNPVLILKVHLQRSDKGHNAGLTEACISPSQRRARGSDIYGIATSIWKKKGIRGFWAGTPLGLAQTVPSTVLYFTSFERIKSIMYGYAGDNNSSLGKLTPGAAGALARIFVVSAVAPIELMRTIQTSGIGLSTTQLASNIYKRQGVAGFYRGWANTVLRDAPFSFIYWLGFDQIKRGARERGWDVYTSTPVTNFISGSIAAGVATIFTHPFDVLKTNQQVDILSRVKKESQGKGGGGTLPGAMTTQSILRGGLPTMFRGLSMRLVTIIPGSAMMVTVYEAVKNGF